MFCPGMSIKYPKQRGEWAELVFMARAAEHGLIVAKPWGESSHYDFAVERGQGFLRVQVKSTMSKQKNSYVCSLSGNRVFYTPEHIDFLAVYIIPLDLWYLIPSAAALRGNRRLRIAPEYWKSIYRPYREAWHLLKQNPPAC
jgi:hypothetical protein